MTKRIKRNEFAVAIVAVLFFLSSCSSEQEIMQQKGEYVPSVEVYTVQHEPVEQVVRVPGSVIPFEQVDLYAEFPGRVKQIAFEEGQTVKKGQVLVQMDTDILVAQREQLRVDLDQAAKDEKRKKQLFETGAISFEEFEQATSRLKRLEADVALISVQIDKSTVVAPFAGKIGLRSISSGAYLTTSTKIASLVQNDKVKIEFAVAEQYASSVHVNDIVFVRTATDTNAVKAIVYATEPAVDPITKMLVVRAEVQGDKGLYPGSYVDVNYNLGELKDAIMVPSSALVPILNGQKIWVIRDNRAISVPVTPGIRTKDQIQVVGDLHVGDQVAITGLLGMREGMEVNVKSK